MIIDREQALLGYPWLAAHNPTRGTAAQTGSGTMEAMTFRLPTSRWAAWAFALALLLKAAVPMLASASAQMQGKALAEVCTVYGVATVALEGQQNAPAGDHGAAHGADHCTLTGLMALAAPEPQPAALPLPAQRVHSVRLVHRAPPAPDACATWVARLKHGPPATA